MRVAACGIIWIASTLVVLALQRRVASVTGGLEVPDVMPLYSPTDLYALLEQYGEPGRRAFLEFTLFDIAYPFIAYAFVALLLTALARPVIAVRPTLVFIVLFPVAGLVVELLEQAGFLLVLRFFPVRVATVAWATSALSLIKLSLLLFLVLLTVSLVACRAWSGVRRLTRRCS
jgi:hypothetical protein